MRILYSLPLCVSVAFMATACVTNTQSNLGTESYAPPINHSPIGAQDARRIVVEHRAEIWKDPYSIRDARAGQPATCNPAQLTRSTVYRNSLATCVCVEANAKNAMGGYVGLRRNIIVVFPDNDITLLDGGTLGFQELCGRTTPFPELSKS